MRLLFLSNFYPPFHFGGYEELCAEVAEGLRRRGHGVSVITSNIGRRDHDGTQDGVYRFLFPEVDLRPYRASLGTFRGRQERLRENIAGFEGLVARLRPDVLIVWGMWNLLRRLLAVAEKWGNPKVVYYIADYWPTLPDALTLHWREPGRRWYSRLPKALLGKVALALLQREESCPRLRFEHAVCVSGIVREHLVQAGMLPSGARVIRNGIDAEQFTQVSDSRNYGGDHSRLRLLYAGSLSHGKGVHTAVEALSLLIARGQAVTLTIMGSGDADYGQSLRRLCGRLDLGRRVVFRSRVSRQQMPHVLSQFDVLLLPSLVADTSPRIVQEAMAAGLTVVGATVGGIPEMIQEGVNGLTFTPGRSEDLALQVGRLIEDEELRRRLAQNGRETVRREFCIKRMLDEVESYLLEVVETRA